MLLVIPISQSDANLIPDIQKAFAKFPPGAGHDLLVIGFPSLSDQISTFAETLSKHFRKTFVHLLPSDNDQGWPMGMNILFRTAAAHVPSLLKENECWLWFEMDTLPLKDNWLSDLHTAYYSDVIPAEKEGRKPRKFLGVKEPSIRAQNGEQLSIERAGHHMAAVGVYPATFESIARPLLKVLHTNNTPFYQVLQWYVVTDLQETTLIQNNKETFNYTPDGKCEGKPRNPWGVNWEKPISKDAVIIHGCKDGTLLKLLLDEPEVAPEPKVEPIIVEPETQPAPQPDQNIPKQDRRELNIERQKQRRKAIWTPERKAKQAEAMRAMQERKRQAKLAEPTGV